jgi:hypothetical protein
MKREPEQTALSSRQDVIRDVKKRLLLKDALHDDPNRSRLLDDKELPGPIICMGQIEWRLKTFGNHWHEFDLELRHTTESLSRSRRPTQQKTEKQRACATGQDCTLH